MSANDSPPADLPPGIALDDEISFQGEMFREYEAGNVHQFILYFNVHDFAFTSSLASQPDYAPLRLRNYLGQLLLSHGFDVVVYYSLADGLSYLDHDSMSPLIQKNFPDRFKGRFYGQHPKNPGSVQGTPGEASVALSYLDRLLTYARPASDDRASIPRIAVILEYLETLAPHEDSHEPAVHRRFVVQMLHQWGLDINLRRNKHIVVGLASDLGQIASVLYTGNSECRAYSVGLPVEETRPPAPGTRPRRERSEWLRWVVDGLESGELDSPLRPDGEIPTVERLAALTSGFNYDDLRDLIYYAAHAKQPLTLHDVQERKRAIITAESRDLLETVDPKHGFELVGGYRYVTEYLGKVKEAILRQGTDPTMAEIVPKGILFLGPPGTGKSFMAAALAKETGFNIVKLKNIRSMWVGESERNLNRVLDLLKSMAPVMVFVDEIDAALGQRSSGGDGGSGVERRIFQRILEFMAMDENRGHVLWIAASNRPDGIDQALISRFDIIIPFLLPDDVAREKMLTESFPEKSNYSFTPPQPDRLDCLVSATVGFSGRELDTVCRRAMQIAGLKRLEPGSDTSPQDKLVVSVQHILDAIADFRVARDSDMYELQTLLAIQNTNFRSFLPTRDEMPAAIVPSDDSGERLDEEKLRQRIDKLTAIIADRERLKRGY